MKYSLMMRINHWIVGLMLLSVAFVGMYMADLPADDPTKYGYYPLHKSFGLLVLLLVIYRVIVRLASSVPPLPKQMKASEVLLAKLVVFAMYFVMFAIPLSGYLMSTLSGREVHFFGLLVPSLFAVNPQMAGLFHSMHGFLGEALLILVGLHVVGWLKHLIFEKLNLINRIV